MKTLGGLLIGALLGAIVVVIALYAFPFAHQARTAKVLVEADARRATESVFVHVLGDAIAGTHGGRFPFKPFPPGIAPLAGRNVAEGFAFLTRTRDARGEISGFATELEVASPRSNLLRGLVMTDTWWTIVLPGRGALFLHETENNWRLVKEVFVPMLLSQRDWAGDWRNVNTFGPRDDGHGVVVGGSGQFAGASGTFLEIGTLRSATLRGELGGELELRLFLEGVREELPSARPVRAPEPAR